MSCSDSWRQTVIRHRVLAGVNGWTLSLPGLSVHPKHGDAFFSNSVSSGWLAALGQRRYRICRVARYVGKLIWLEGSYNLSVLEALGWPLKGPITVDSIDAYGHSFLPVLTEASGYKIETKLHIAHRLPSHSFSPFPFSLCFPPLSLKFLFFSSCLNNDFNSAMREQLKSYKCIIFNLQSFERCLCTKSLWEIPFLSHMKSRHSDGIHLFWLRVEGAWGRGGPCLSRHKHHLSCSSCPS